MRSVNSINLRDMINILNVYTSKQGEIIDLELCLYSNLMCKIYVTTLMNYEN